MSKYITASAMAKQKQRIIEKVLDRYFMKNNTINPGQWDEKVLAEIAVMDCISDGSEVFRMGEEDLIRFGTMVTKIEIESNHAICLFHQSIEELYE